jgi:hypothetical protein
MGALLEYSVSTVLDRNRVWSAFADIENWSKFSPIYSNLRWSGFPWQFGSSILGTIAYPRELTVRYALEHCDPAIRVSYIGHSSLAGFASHREIRFVDSEDGGTTLRVSYYVAGNGNALGDGQSFVKTLLERWFREFAEYCDRLAQKHTSTAGERFQPERVRSFAASATSRRANR